MHWALKRGTPALCLSPLADSIVIFYFPVLFPTSSDIQHIEKSVATRPGQKSHTLTSVYLFEPVNICLCNVC